MLFLSQFPQVLIPFGHAFLELFIKILAHLVELIPFLYHSLPLAVPHLIRTALLDQFFTQLPLQKLQMTLIRLVFLSLQTKDLFKGVIWQCLIGCLGYLCAFQGKRCLKSCLGIKGFIEFVDSKRLCIFREGKGYFNGGHADYFLLAIACLPGWSSADKQYLQLNLQNLTFCTGISYPLVQKSTSRTALKRSRLPLTCAEGVGGENLLSSSHLGLPNRISSVYW